jgi:hypothetical protein
MNTGDDMRVYNINTMNDCKKLIQALKDKGYTLWQMQYSWDLPEGFLCWFMKAGKDDIEIHTKNADVQKALIDTSAM